MSPTMLGTTYVRPFSRRPFTKRSVSQLATQPVGPWYALGDVPVTTATAEEVQVPVTWPVTSLTRLPVFWTWMSTLEWM